MVLYNITSRLLTTNVCQIVVLQKILKMIRLNIVKIITFINIRAFKIIICFMPQK